MYSQSLIKMLEERVTEVEWFAQQHQLRLEPHRYPKGLFKVQVDPVHRYKISAYVNELRQDLHFLSQLTLPLMRSKSADKLLQKINVLINTFRSQSLRTTKNTRAHSVLENLDLTKDNVYEQLANKNQPKTTTLLTSQLEKQQSDLIYLTASKNKKVLDLKRCNDAGKMLTLQNSVLELSKQMGTLEQRISRIKEELARR